LIEEIEQEARRAGPKAMADYAAAGARYRLARQVFDLRRAAKLTRRQLAAKLGAQQGDISRIEAADANPTLATIAALAYALEPSCRSSRATRVGRIEGTTAAPRGGVPQRGGARWPARDEPPSVRGTREGTRSGTPRREARTVNAAITSAHSPGNVSWSVTWQVELRDEGLPARVVVQRRERPVGADQV
jgi:DNA-binding XRE family transcriptional regulator